MFTVFSDDNWLGAHHVTNGSDPETHPPRETTKDVDPHALEEERRPSTRPGNGDRLGNVQEDGKEEHSEEPEHNGPHPRRPEEQEAEGSQEDREEKHGWLNLHPKRHEVILDDGVPRIPREDPRKRLCVAVSLSEVVSPVLLRHVVDDRLGNIADLVSLLRDPIAHLRILRVIPTGIEAADVEEHGASERGVRPVREACERSPVRISPLDVHASEPRCALLISEEDRLPRGGSDLRVGKRPDE